LGAGTDAAGGLVAASFGTPVAGSLAGVGGLAPDGPGHFFSALAFAKASTLAMPLAPTATTRGTAKPIPRPTNSTANSSISRWRASRAVSTVRGAVCGV
jgi:hypothetical protein